MNTPNQEQQPDPIDQLWDTVGNLLAEHGEERLLQTIACYAECESKDEDMCDGCRSRGEAIHRIVEQAIKT